MSKANGVPPAVGGLTARSLGYKTKREGDYRSLDFLVTLTKLRLFLRSLLFPYLALSGLKRPSGVTQRITPDALKLLYFRELTT